MYQKFINYLKEKPALYTESTKPFWDDEHISKGMLAAHLAVNVEAASRKYDYIVKSAKWIYEVCGEKNGLSLLDLGCGPGIYAERFHKEGFQVTGIDFSKRSIQYAKEQAKEKGLAITYHYQNYLDMEYENSFDVVTLIYCDFRVLSIEDRAVLLGIIRKALKKDGLLILDGWSPQYMEKFSEERTVNYSEGGFWNEKEYACIQSNYRGMRTQKICWNSM